METQIVRGVERVERNDQPLLDRIRGRRRVDPLRETADGLGVVLDQLSESIADVLPRRSAGFVDDDSEDGEIEASRRTRGFKLRHSEDVVPTDPEASVPASTPATVAATVAEASAPASVEVAQEASAEVVAADAVGVVQDAQTGASDQVTHEQIAAEVDDVMNILREARNVAAEAVAPPVVMPAHERAEAQARLKELFVELGMKRIEIISSIFSSPEEAAGFADVFTLATPDGAKAAYKGIDAMIMKYLNAGRDEETVGAGSIYEGHEAAMNATEQLKEFLRHESPEKAFTRFREVNRSNILGLLQ